MTDLATSAEHLSQRSTNPVLIGEIALLHAAYSRALDGKDMAAWLATFTDHPESSYVCLSRENVDAGLPLALMMDDCRARLIDRVSFITKIWAGTFQDYRTRHFIQLLSLDDDGGELIHATSNFTVMYTPEDSGISGVLAIGVYEDTVESSATGGLRLRSRRAILDTSVLPRYLVYPV